MASGTAGHNHWEPGDMDGSPVVTKQKKISEKKKIKKSENGLTDAAFHAMLSKLTISTEGICRCSTMVRAPAFQAGDASSILVTCSIKYAPVAQLDRATAF